MLLAIDPGLEHGIAVLDFDGRLLLASEFPVVGEGANRRLALGGLPDLIGQYRITRAVIEQVSAMPRQGVTASFRFGRATGQVEGALMALRLPLDFAHPATWKRFFGVNSGDKGRMRALAVQEWPAFTEQFRLVKHEHRAEAALLALWAVRKMKRDAA